MTAKGLATYGEGFVGAPDQGFAIGWTDLSRRTTACSGTSLSDRLHDSNGFLASRGANHRLACCKIGCMTARFYLQANGPVIGMPFEVHSTVA